MKISVNKQQLALYLIVLSIPLNWYGITNFQVGGTPGINPLLFSILFTAGICSFCYGIYLAYIIFTDREGRGESLLASQTKVEDPPILKPIPNPIKKEKKMNEKVHVQNPPGERSSVELIQREKELKAEEQELQHQLERIRLEKVGLEQALQAKGWIRNYEREWDVPAL
jgi:hypothetical protein|tara:strand:- start:281 stop:787 length:507 start_codon:yes stop_codon:yes gene_type:complete